jgi:two-component system response regulator AlgR
MRCRRSRPRRSTTSSSPCAPSAWPPRWSACAPSPLGREKSGDNGAGPVGQRRSHLCARLRGSLRLIPIEDVHYLHAEEKYVVVHHARGEDLIEESLKSLEDEFGERFVRIHRNCLVARHEIVELRRAPDGHVQAVLRHGKAPLEVSRRCVAHLRETVKHL